MKTITALRFATVFVLAGCVSGTPQSAPATSPTETCKAASREEIAGLFDRWNRSLQSGDPHQVVGNYADGSILLPTLSNKVRVTAEEKEDYFHHFLENKPVGRIDWRSIEIGCNTAVDSGLYTFVYGTTGAQVKARYTYTYRWNGSQWLITSHHSSGMPESE